MSSLQRIAAHGQTWMAVARNRAARRGEEGQGTLEYVGLAVLIGIIITAIFGLNLDQKISDALSKVFDKITKGN